ncbi:MAG: glycosyltransferase family 2 protein [Lachnospiraceae bacterium]|nr:glycosyltransferase family 2 protein [Lachnospiraceae bacterium]
MDDRDTGKVTLVIPNYNGKAFLEECLKSILAGSLVPHIIVVDNASTDGSRELVKEKFPEADLVALPVNTGFCHAVNAGIHLTKTEFVFLLNNDTTVEPDCVRALLETLSQDDQAFSVQAKMLSMRDPSKIDDAGDLYAALGWAFARGKGKDARRYETGGEVFSACAGAAMYRMDGFREIGLFDERHFCYLEDVDIGYRAKLFGYRNLYEPKAVVRHYGSAVSGSAHNPFKEEMAAGNNRYLLYKNMPLWQRVLNAPLLWIGRGIKYRYFRKKGLGDAFQKGLARGSVLKERAKAYTHGSLAEEAGIARQELEQVNPLYLGEKIPFAFSRLPRYFKVQWELWTGVFKRLYD